MEGSNNILDLLRKALENDEEMYSKPCKVTQVNESEGTINAEPLDGDAEILDVKLKAGDSESPFLCIPKVDSIVIVTFTGFSSGFVSMFSDIETVNIRGDQYGGLIKIEELTKQLDIVTSRIDTLYDAINNGATTAQDGGATLLASMKAITALQIKTEDFTKIENENVKHG